MVDRILRALDRVRLFFAPRTTERDRAVSPSAMGPGLPASWHAALPPLDPDRAPGLTLAPDQAAPAVRALHEVLGERWARAVWGPWGPEDDTLIDRSKNPLVRAHVLAHEATEQHEAQEGHAESALPRPHAALSLAGR